MRRDFKIRIVLMAAMLPFAAGAGAASSDRAMWSSATRSARIDPAQTTTVKVLRPSVQSGVKLRAGNPPRVWSATSREVQVKRSSRPFSGLFRRAASEEQAAKPAALQPSSKRARLTKGKRS